MLACKRLGFLFKAANWLENSFSSVYMLTNKQKVDPQYLSHHYFKKKLHNISALSGSK